MNSVAQKPTAPGASSALDRIVQDVVGERSSERIAALYVRVSTGKQKDNWSVKDQLGLVRLGQERGLRVEVYDDSGISGERIEDRPAMQRLLDDIRAGKVAAIICVATNRLSRDEDIIDTLVIQKACREHGTIVITPEKVFDYAERTDTIYGQIKAIFDADQKQALVKATTRGQYAKARSGQWVAGLAPVGYRLAYTVAHADGRPRGDLEIDPEEAEIVRLIYDLYVYGPLDAQGERAPLSQAGVARFLNESGSRVRARYSTTKPDTKRPRRYKAGEMRRFEPQDIARVTTSRLYLGMLGWGEGRLSKWVRDEGPVEVHRPDLQIIDVDLWQKAQAVRRERATHPRRNACSTAALSGLLRCPSCDGPLYNTHRRERDGYSNYQCAAWRKYGRAVCQGFIISERATRRAVETLLVDHLERLRLSRFLDQAAEEGARASEGEIAQGVRVELQQTQERLDRLVRSVAEGVFTPAEARTLKLEYLEKKARLESRLAKLHERTQLRDELLDSLAYVQGNLRALIAKLSGVQFRSLARLVFAHLTVTAEGRGPARVACVLAHEHTERYKDLLSTFGTPALVSESKVYLERGPLADVLALLAPAA